MNEDQTDNRIFCYLRTRGTGRGYPLFEWQVLEWEKALPELRVREVLWALKDLLEVEPRFRRSKKGTLVFIEEQLEHWQEGTE